MTALDAASGRTDDADRTSGEELAAYFADVAVRLARQRTTDDVMAVIVDVAVEVVPRCDHASISYRRGKALVSASSSDAVGELLDDLQTRFQEGPCLDAIRTGEVQSCDELSCDDRWPKYGPEAERSTGVRSSVGVPLHDGRKVIGALNLFSESIGALEGDRGATAMSTLLAAHAAPALSASLHRDDLAVALANRDVIGQAKGLLMARSNVDADQAFDLLKQASQRMNVKLHEVARRLVEGQLAGPEPDGEPS